MSASFLTQIRFFFYFYYYLFINSLPILYAHILSSSMSCQCNTRQILCLRQQNLLECFFLSMTQGRTIPQIFDCFCLPQSSTFAFKLLQAPNNNIQNDKLQEMNQKTIDDPQQARYLRRKHKDDGVDEQEEEQERNFHHNPTEAISKSFKHKTQRNLQKQVEYYGNAIQPFHMREEQEMGNIDDDGFFIFTRRKLARDPWLESLQENEQDQAADKLVKKIKTESRFKSVYQADDKINEDYREQDQSNSDSEKEKEEQQEQGEQMKEQLNMKQVIQLVIELIPENSNANKYMKKLKVKKQMQQYNKILFLCNLYIQKTGEHDILTKKRQQLQEMVEDEHQKQQSAQLNWDQESEKQEKEKEYQKGEKLQQGVKKAQNAQNDDEDNIF